ncbi:hypothetical protein evm_008093 [Chilo suppressalis]|nr:hypothetical protein evm_008093 [Chilo suppressalis]
MGDQKHLSRVPPCFGRHFKPLVPAASAVVSTHIAISAPFALTVTAHVNESIVVERMAAGSWSGDRELTNVVSRPETRWSEDIRKAAGSDWMRRDEARSQEAYI